MQVPVRYLVWGGPFLSKVDLSEVSFDGVEWDLNYYSKLNDLFIKDVDYYKNINCIDLSNTNAKINFENSFAVSVFGEVVVTRCNFSNLDLSDSNLYWITRIVDSDFSNSKGNWDFIPGNGLEIIHSNLSGIDLSFMELRSELFCDKLNDVDFDSFAIESNFSNTGLVIHHDVISISDEERDKIARYKELDSISECCFEEVLEFQDLKRELAHYLKTMLVGKNLGKLLKQGYLDGCILNGKKILSLEERKKIASDLLEKYRSFENDMAMDVFDLVQEQIIKCRKKKLS